MRVAYEEGQMCIRTRCRSVEQLICVFKHYVDGTTLFVSMLDARPVGTETPFVIALADGTIVLRGLGVIHDVWMDSCNPYRRPGALINIRALTRSSKPIYERMRGGTPASSAAVRATAGRAAATPRAPSSSDGAPKLPAPHEPTSNLARPIVRVSSMPDGATQMPAPSGTSTVQAAQKTESRAASVASIAAWPHDAATAAAEEHGGWNASTYLGAGPASPRTPASAADADDFAAYIAMMPSTPNPVSVHTVRVQRTRPLVVTRKVTIPPAGTRGQAARPRIETTPMYPHTPPPRPSIKPLVTLPLPTHINVPTASIRPPSRDACAVPEAIPRELSTAPTGSLREPSVHRTRRTTHPPMGVTPQLLPRVPPPPLRKVKASKLPSTEATIPTSPVTVAALATPKTAASAIALNARGGMVLPVNPLLDISDSAIAGYVDRTLFESERETVGDLDATLRSLAALPTSPLASSSTALEATVPSIRPRRTLMWCTLAAFAIGGAALGAHSVYSRVARSANAASIESAASDEATTFNVQVTGTDVHVSAAPTGDATATQTRTTRQPPSVPVGEPGTPTISAVGVAAEHRGIPMSLTERGNRHRREARAVAEHREGVQDDVDAELRIAESRALSDLLTTPAPPEPSRLRIDVVVRPRCPQSKCD